MTRNVFAGYQIYALKCPLSNQIRYVGFTTKLLKYRLWKHVNEAKNGYGSNKHKNSWLNILSSKNLSPEIILIKDSSEIEWEKDEQFYIDYYRKIGCDLVNIVGGGKSGLNRKHSEATKQKQRLASIGNKNWLGRQHSDFSKNLMSQVHAGKKCSQETKNKLSVAGINRIVSVETRNKLSKLHKGKVLSEETKKRISVATTGKPKHRLRNSNLVLLNNTQHGGNND